MIVAGYLRVSTNRQDLESQEYQLREWAKANNHDINLYKDFAVSGKTKQREGIDALLRDAEAHKFEAVAVIELSRIGRSIGFIHSTVEKLNTLSIKVILANSNTTLDPTTTEGVALLGGLGLAAAIELKLIEERNKRGREKIARDKIKVGRKPSELKGINLNAVLEFKQQGKGIREIARLLNTSPPTVLRMLRRYNNGHISNVTESNQNLNETH